MTDNFFPEVPVGATPLQRVKLYCSWCMGDGVPRECESKTCPLFPLRTGRNTAHRRKMTPEQKRKATERLKSIREAKKALAQAPDGSWALFESVEAG